MCRVAELVKIEIGREGRLEHHNNMPVLVVDNGAYEIKAGYATEDPELHVVSNSIARSTDRRTYIGNQVRTCKDYHGLVYRRPHEKGQLVSWECQKAIWDHIFFGKDTTLDRPDGTGIVDPSDTSLILTEMPYSLPALSSHMDQIVFEEYGFDSYYRCTAGSLVPWNDINNELFGDKTSRKKPVAECAMVIDCGFSATHVMPVLLGEVYFPAVKRITPGGKMLTNYLKETVSFRHYNMMEDSYLMNLIKEATCFVSPNFSEDLERCHKNKKSYMARYLLPDFKTTRTGYLLSPDDPILSQKEDSQILSLTNERFTVPELLFNPSDVGLDQAGIPETVMRSINSMPADVRSMLLANVVLVGGTAKLPGFKERLTKDLRTWAPTNSYLRVAVPESPDTYAWKGGCALGRQTEMLQKAHVTKQDYMEYGVNRCLSSFGIKVQEALDKD